MVVGVSATSFLRVVCLVASLGVKAQQDYCSGSLVLLDTCDFKYDGECDSGTIYCDEESDCFDCDPCRQYSDSCAACTTNPFCGYCPLDMGTSVCLSLGFMEALPNLCASDGGSGWLSSSSQCSSVPAVTTASSALSCSTDACQYEYDLECDAGMYCDENTDCFDCDPCQANAVDCTQCLDEGCQFGTMERTILGFLTTSYPVCSSAKNAMTARSEQSVSVTYQASCSGDDDNTISITDTSDPADYECDYSNDSCMFPFDGECDAGTMFCERSSDCFDCDPCQKYRFEGCEACTAAGCAWCATDAICLSPSVSVSDFPAEISCRATSDFTTTCRASTTLSADGNQPQNEPLYDAQAWMFDLINVQEAWDMGYTGKGIGVRVNDDGVDHTHEEIQDRFDIQSSCSIYKPAGLNRKHSHGTAVASLVAGSAGGNTCGSGVAYGATLSGCRVISSENGEDVAFELDDSSVYYDNMERMHISQNSFGVPTCRSSSRRRRRNLQQTVCPFDNDTVCDRCSAVDWDNPSPNTRCENTIASYCKSLTNFSNDPEACRDFLDLFTECRYNNLEVSDQNAMRKGSLEGRNGKGIVYVFASGNDHHSGADVNFEGILTSRYTISVGAVDKGGLHSSYSTGGAALHVVAPGGDADHYTNNIAALSGGGCFDVGPGTSFAAPIVSGVVALMLEANEELTWRDVQGILATTSKKVDYGEDKGRWTKNGAGLEHSYLYGYGLVDAGAAVNAALGWVSYPEERQAVAESGIVNISIPEYPGDAVTSNVEVKTNDLVVESVSVYLDLTHSSRGDLEITLVSPSGTESILHPSRRPENSQYERWKLLTVRHWGEEGDGEWTIRLVDHREGHIDTCVDEIWGVQLTDTLEVGCRNLEKSLACSGGRKGPEFDSIFTGGLDSEFLRSADGLTPDKACCACGGGKAADDFANVLLSWRLVLSGHVRPLGAFGTAATGNNTDLKLPTRTSADPLDILLDVKSSNSIGSNDRSENSPDASSSFVAAYVPQGVWAAVSLFVSLLL